ncbi:MAG: PQQ-like beta-propeller repeat protein [Sandaracinaceae bacterium]|nr:PQQ-like beta-propeller repeat protein [Sandaracinaceae bacterium]
MDRRRLLIGGMWVAAIAAIVAIYLTLEPPVDDVQTREGGEARTFVAGEDVAEGPSRIGLAVAEDTGSVAHYRGGVRHTGRSPFRGPASAARAWQHEIGARISAQSVLGEDGTIYVGAHDHRFYAISPTGEERWSVPMHQKVWSAAAVVGDTVFVGSDADAFFALDTANGHTRWRIRAEGDADGAPAIYDGHVYFTAGPHLYAVTLDGELQWRFQARGPFLISSPAIDSDGTIYVGSIDDHVYAVAPDGRQRWEYRSGGNISSSPVIGDDGLIYFGSDDEYVHALDRDGHRVWRTHLDGFIRAPVALGRNGDVIAAVYGPRPRVVSMSASDGELRWYFPVNVTESPEIGVASGPLVDRDGNLYFGAHDDFLYAISGEGALRWIHRFGEDIDSAPILAEDGTLIVGCDDGFLYAIVEDQGRSDAGAGADAGAEGEAAAEVEPHSEPASEPEPEPATEPAAGSEPASAAEPGAD